MRETLEATGAAMRAMQLRQLRTPLALVELPVPEPAAGQLLLKVTACAVCRTDLHLLDGELDDPRLPLVPGHQIVGVVQALGPGAHRFSPGDRVGVPWLGQTCGRCALCVSGRENLCESAVFTGYHRDGGFAQFAVAAEQFCFALPADYSDAQAAPLLCAGLIGYRAYRLAGDAPVVGLYGFGAAAHILCQLAAHQRRTVYAFTRPGDDDGQAFARSLGAEWAGGSDEPPPKPLDAAIVFASAGELATLALRSTAPGGRVVCAGIHMSDIPSFPYRWLWRERTLRSVANLTRADGEEFLRLAPAVPVRTEVTRYALAQANRALEDLRAGRFNGAAVVLPWEAG